MKSSEFKKEFFALLDRYNSIEKLDSVIAEVVDFLVDYQKINENLLNTENKGLPWSDEDLEAILSELPTKENCAKFARRYKRGYGSIEQIYRWAYASDTLI